LLIVLKLALTVYTLTLFTHGEFMNPYIAMPFGDQFLIISPLLIRRCFFAVPTNEASCAPFIDAEGMRKPAVLQRKQTAIPYARLFPLRVFLKSCSEISCSSCFEIQIYQKIPICGICCRHYPLFGLALFGVDLGFIFERIEYHSFDDRQVLRRHPLPGLIPVISKDNIQTPMHTLYAPMGAHSLREIGDVFDTADIVDRQTV